MADLKKQAFIEFINSGIIGKFTTEATAMYKESEQAWKIVEYREQFDSVANYGRTIAELEQSGYVKIIIAHEERIDIIRDVTEDDYPIEEACKYFLYFLESY